jgi:hypothetical protein
MLHKWALQDLNQNPQVTNRKDVMKIHQNSRVHNPVHLQHFSSDLLQIIGCWDDLPEHIKAAVKTLIESVNK